MSDRPDEAPEQPEAVLIAVPDGLVDELVEHGLVGEYPGLRQSIADAVLTVGESALTLVTMRYTPDRVGAIAGWLHRRFNRTTIEVTDTRRGVTFTLRGETDSVGAVAEFISNAVQPDDRPHVFVCYAHDSDDHKAQVRQFAGFLIRNGINTVVDCWGLDERRDWQQWATAQITSAAHIIVIASPRCKLVGDGNHGPLENRGLRSELNLIRELYHSQPDIWPQRILPVVLPGRSVAEIPLFLQPNTADHYIVVDFTVSGSEDLLRKLTNQPPYRRPEIGEPPDLPARD